ncbi:MAG: hypothetical protein Q8N68_01965 [bacterium]|nr:hypothetical protein [bacterium]
MQKISWILELKQKTPQFLKKLKGQKIPGFFHYSLSGDLYNEDLKWGLGNTVFAVKIYYTLGLLHSLKPKEKNDLIRFIQTFRDNQGYFFDPLIREKSRGRNLLISIKHKNWSNWQGRETMIAETRQALSALKLLGEKIAAPTFHIPNSPETVTQYLQKLPWSKPYHAASHFSHLLFFLKNSDLANKSALIDNAIAWIKKIQNPQDGAWHQGSPPQQEKINGAMKIITGLKVAEKMNFKYPEKLIDLCLAAKNGKHACDHFNLVYVLHYAHKIAGGNYRLAEIKKFSEERLEIYKKYHFPEIGGFSFWARKANDRYYGAKITRGLNEPDIHGTCMFLWGISIIAQILKINKELGFHEHTP